MRVAMLLAAGVVAAGLAGIAKADQNSSPASASSAGAAWCGFHTKAGSRVRCGFSSEAECKQTLGSKDTVCIVDPYRS